MNTKNTTNPKTEYSIRIKEAAEERGYTNVKQFQDLIGVKPKQASELFSNDLDSIDIEILNKLCNRLKCQPNDIFKIKSD